MAPPTFGDLGKSCRDVFGKGYHFGLIKLELKTKTKDAVDITAGGSLNQDSGKVFGALETKYKVKDYGLVFTEKWNTDNSLCTEVSVEDRLAKGLKLSFDSTFSPQSGKKTGRVKTQFKHDCMAMNMDVDLDLAGPLIKGSSVFCYNGWLAGYQMTFDSAKSKFTKNNFAVGYSAGDFVLHTSVNDGQEYLGSLYQKVNPKLETGIQLAWSAGSTATRFEMGCKYSLAKNAAVRAKVDNSSCVGLGYQQELRDGVTLTLSALIDGKNLNQGGHKIGLALDLEA
ncbi:voltage-dependent anion-selective channel protein 2-like [Ischnura elegans]|uniref:voltage-dependent anion-selective channel protein 2-like n=1 Tax=Ischnura elegans TaxID=197161 RepID=UPI001ED87F25|nr:voltage-dependent anion-selective channel protein 2-like [Ischnura elegans]XP_046395774.1 voltage-dependent anion-selective channel protein 2-like [Ischnura elegans]XP_046395781.1 voltage-dependent anion-selective channel protein 2-like [Ischnura elegans]